MTEEKNVEKKVRRFSLKTILKTAAVVVVGIGVGIGAAVVYGKRAGETTTE